VRAITISTSVKPPRSSADRLIAFEGLIQASIE
jgi:hypothetical protein